MAIRQHAQGRAKRESRKGSGPTINVKLVENSSQAGPSVRITPDPNDPTNLDQSSRLTPREATALLERLDRISIAGTPDYVGLMEAFAKLRRIAGDYRLLVCPYCKWVTGHASNCPYEGHLEVD